MSLTIAVLTGRRPGLLARTLSSFVEHHPDIWYSATRTVLHNSGDVDTQLVLNGYDWHDRTTTTGGLLRIGEASQLLGRQVEQADTDLVMRLEDDWEARPAVWWDDAVALLERVAQVRLQAAEQRVSSTCLVCRTRTLWTPVAAGHLVGHSHYTHRPSLMKTETFLRLFPYENEPDAMRKLHGRKVAQHVPGVFSHLGVKGKSLKRNGGRR